VGKRAARYFLPATFSPPACPPTISTYYFVYKWFYQVGKRADRNVLKFEYRAARLPTLQESWE